MDVVLYHEITRTQTSKVLAIIKEINNSSITRFENLRDKNACFPEYGGIGKWFNLNLLSLYLN